MLICIAEYRGYLKDHRNTIVGLLSVPVSESIEDARENCTEDDIMAKRPMVLIRLTDRPQQRADTQERESKLHIQHFAVRVILADMSSVAVKEFILSAQWNLGNFHLILWGIVVSYMIVKIYLAQSKDKSNISVQRVYQRRMTSVRYVPL